MKLTAEQAEIINYVVEGQTNIQIAEEMGFSERSINRRLKKIFKIFGVENKPSLIREAMAMQYAELI